MLKRIFTGSEFSRNVITLVTGTGLAQAITFLAAPVLSRLFSPGDFAVLALFTAVSAIFSVVATARYEMAVPLPESDADARNVVSLALRITLLVSLLSLLGVAGYDLVFSEKSPKFSSWFYLIPLSVLASGSYAVFNYWSTRKRTFRLNSAGRIISAAVTAGLGMLTGYFLWGPRGLVIAFVAGQVMSSVVMMAGAGRGKAAFFSGSGKAGRRAVAQRYRNFALINSPHALLDSLQDNGVVFLLSYYFLDAVVGWFSFAFRILKAPVGLIGAAFYQVFYQRVSEAKNKGENIQPLVLGIYKRMFLIGFPGFFILFLFTPDLFSWIFGVKWKEAGSIAQVLIPWLFLNFIVSPVSCIPLVYNRQRDAFLITIFDSIIRATALIIGGMKGDYRLSFLVISIFCSGLMLFAMWWYYAMAKKKD